MIVVHPEIVLLGDPVLRRKAEPVERITPTVHTLADRMIRIMHEADGLGLAAPQIGVPLRLFVAYDGERDYVFVNPRIVAQSGREVRREGCLSLPGLYGDVPRAQSVTLLAKTRLGREVKVEASGLFARVIQHEVDHLNGVLFIDHRPQDLHLVLERNPKGEEDPLVERIPIGLEEVEEFYHFLRESRLLSVAEAWERFQKVQVR